MFRFIEWPQLASAITGIASLIFLLCTASFAVVLILGGGPQATTLEVAIYQSLRLDFDPARASILALAQLVTCGLLVLVAGQFAREIQVVPPTLARIRRWDGRSGLSKIIDGLAIALAIVIVVPPILSVVLSGIGNIRLDGSLLWATATSLLIGLASASLSIALGWVLAETAARQPRTFLKSAITLGLPRFAHHAACRSGHGLVCDPQPPCRHEPLCDFPGDHPQCPHGAALRLVAALPGNHRLGSTA